METTQAVLTRLRAEYVEMPSLSLTAEQVQRLCGIEPTVCRWVLDALVDERALRVTAEGHYVRHTNGESPRSHPATTDLGAHARFLKAS